MATGIRLGKSLKAARFLRTLRVRSEKSIPQIAEEVGVSNACVATWEKGASFVSERNFDKATNAYGMTEEEKNQYIELSLSIRPSKTESTEPLTESQVFYGWIALPEEFRKRILRAMNAYENPPQQ